jgi:hypothetical protein
LRSNWTDRPYKVFSSQSTSNHAYAMKSPYKPKRTGIREHPDSWTHVELAGGWRFLDDGKRGESREVLCIFSSTSFLTSFYNTPVNVFPWILCASRRDCWTPDL